MIDIVSITHFDMRLSIILFAAFFIFSALFMVLWNNCVKKCFKEDTIKEVDYPLAMGMTLFFSLFIRM